VAHKQTTSPAAAKTGDQQSGMISKKELYSRFENQQTVYRRAPWMPKPTLAVVLIALNAATRDASIRNRILTGSGIDDQSSTVLGTCAPQARNPLSPL
jgi:hypothetical protein